MEVETAPRYLPGPTGESNRLTTHPRGAILCLGPGEAALKAQAQEAASNGCTALLKDGFLVDDLVNISDIHAVSYWGDHPRAYAVALAKREGSILPLILEPNRPELYIFERHLCIDTTASGGNTALLSN